MIRKTVIAVLCVAATAALVAGIWSFVKPISWTGSTFPHLPYEKYSIDDGQLIIGRIHAVNGGPLVRERSFLVGSYEAWIELDPALSTPESPVAVVHTELAFSLLVLFLLVLVYPAIALARTPRGRSLSQRLVMGPPGSVALAMVRRSRSRQHWRRVVVALSLLAALGTIALWIAGHAGSMVLDNHQVHQVDRVRGFVREWILGGDRWPSEFAFVARDYAAAEWLGLDGYGTTPPRVSGWLWQWEFEEGRRVYLRTHGGALTIAIFAKRDPSRVVSEVYRQLGAFGVVQHDIATPSFLSHWVEQAFSEEHRQWAKRSAAVVRGVSVPMWAVFMFFMILPAAAVVRGPVRRWLLHRHGLCVHCAYDLTGNTTGRCPECGAAVPPDAPGQRPAKSE